MPNTIPAAATGLPAANLKPALVGAGASTMPATASGRAVWAKSLMIEAAKVWAGAVRLRGNPSADHIQAALEEVAGIRDAILTIAFTFADALDGDRKALENYLSDGIGDGLEFPLQRRLEEMGDDDGNAEHRLSAGTQLSGRRW